MGYELDGEGGACWGGDGEGESELGELQCICMVDAIGFAMQILSEGCRELGGWVARLQD